MADPSKTVYLPRMKVREGMRHGYRNAKGIKVVVVDPDKPQPEAAAKVSRKGG